MIKFIGTIKVKNWTVRETKVGQIVRIQDEDGVYYMLYDTVVKSLGVINVGDKLEIAGTTSVYEYQGKSYSNLEVKMARKIKKSKTLDPNNLPLVVNKPEEEPLPPAPNEDCAEEDKVMEDELPF